MNDPTRSAVLLGAGGFVGAELLRLLLTHPRLRLAVALSDSHAGLPIGEVHRELAPLTELRFTATSDWSPEMLRSGAWTVFAALGHGESMLRLPALLDAVAGRDVQLIDLSGDFRLRRAEEYARAYGRQHVAAERLGSFVYGLPELHRAAIGGAQRIANPGCFATCATLALLPAAAARWPVRGVAVDGMTGSSGAGVQARPTTHHPRRAHNIEAYSCLRHAHVPELRQSWVAAGGAPETPISFAPHRAPIVRGIYVSAHLFVDPAVTQEQALAQYRDYYRDAPFVRVLDKPPGVVDVWGSNRCELAVTAGEGLLVVNATIDNLVKGAGGQAVQNANLMNGWDETAGLLTPMPRPV